MNRFGYARQHRSPVVLTVPGLNNSGPDHWQTLWEQRRGDCQRVDLGRWASPNRNAWVTRLDAAIRAIDGPVILAAHSLGCITVAWWGALQNQSYGWPVTGALLVAPPDCDRAETPDSIGNFGPVPRSQLPFPSILVASRDDPYIFFERAHSMGKNWGSHFVDAGHCGHINAASDVGDWSFGQTLLDQLIDDAQMRAISADPGLPAIRPSLPRRTDMASSAHR